MTGISALITQIRELLPLMPKGKWGQFHPHYHEEAKASGFRDWDTSHDLSAFDGAVRQRVGTFTHADVAMYAELLNPVTVTALLDRIEELEKERDQAVGKRRVWVEWCTRVLRHHRQLVRSAESRLAEARAEALEEAAKAVERFIPLCFDGTIAGRSIKDEKQALLRDVARAIRALKSGGAND